MFPNLKAELARRDITVIRLHELLIENGTKISIASLRNKLLGHREFTLSEALAIFNLLHVDIPFEYLFERKSS